MPTYESLQSESSHSGPSPSASINMTGRSDRLVQTPIPKDAYEPRSYYLKKRDLYPPPYIAHSHFVPKATVEFLMRWKKDRAIGVKFVSNKHRLDRITDLEGALHTFAVPIVKTTMHGDYRWAGGHGVVGFGSKDGFQLGRGVLVSALVQQDFEGERVMLKVAALRSEETIGEPDLPPPLLTKDKQDSALRGEYDNRIRRYLVYHLTANHRLPRSGSNIIKEEAMTLKGTLDFLAKAIKDVPGKDLPKHFQHVFLHHKGSFVSLEVMFSTAVHQIRAEMLLLERLCSKQGYVYTFNPPAIFVRYFGDLGTELLSRIHVAALKHFASTTQMRHCKVFAWADFSSPHILSLIRRALASQPHIVVMSNDQLFAGHKGKPEWGLYAPPKEAEGALLVVHNNSDAFGQNIETEHSGGSLDGVIGTYSSTSASLMRDRKDLCDHLFEVPSH